MSLQLPELPFAYDALEPFLSEEAVGYHYQAHHAGYVANVNSFITGTELEFRTLEEIIQRSSGKLLANAVQAWNHTFYWHCLTPGGADAPSGPLTRVIEHQFGSWDRCRRQFTDAAVSLFGSGWVWLVRDQNGGMEVIPDNNAAALSREAVIPILVCDLWEHAYYLDYRNARDEYLEAFWNMVNWDFVARQYLTDATHGSPVRW